MKQDAREQMKLSLARVGSRGDVGDKVLSSPAKRMENRLSGSLPTSGMGFSNPTGPTNLFSCAVRKGDGNFIVRIVVPHHISQSRIFATPPPKLPRTYSFPPL